MIVYVHKIFMQEFYFYAGAAALYVLSTLFCFIFVFWISAVSAKGSTSLHLTEYSFEWVDIFSAEHSCLWGIDIFPARGVEQSQSNNGYDSQINRCYCYTPSMHIPSEEKK